MKNGDRVKIELFDISGRLIGVPVDRQLNAGEYNISLADLGLANQVYIARITSGGRTAQLRVAFVNDGRSGYIGGTGFSKRNGNLAKISAVVDTEIVTAKGYIIARKTITSFSGTGNLTLLPSAGALLNAIPDLKKLLPKSLNNGVHSATVAAAVGDSTVIVPADEPDVLSAGYYELKDAISNNSFNNLSILLKLGMAGKPVVPDSDMALGSVRIPTGMKVLDMYDTVQDLGHVIISQLSVDTCEYRWYSLQRSKQSASDTGTPASILCYLRFIGNDTASMKVEGTFKIDLGGGSIMDHAISYDATTGKIVEITVPGSCDLATQVGTVDGIRQQIISKGSEMTWLVQTSLNGEEMQKRAWANDSSGVLIYDSRVASDTGSSMDMAFFNGSGKMIMVRDVGEKGDTTNRFLLKYLTTENGYSFAKKEGAPDQQSQPTFTYGYLNGTGFVVNPAISEYSFWTGDPGSQTQTNALSYNTSDSIPASPAIFSLSVLVNTTVDSLTVFEATRPAFDATALQAEADAIAILPDSGTFPIH